MTQSRGKVYLVGAGPGDPGLLSLKGRDCIANADVVVYDYLASPQLLAHARADAECIYVGKKGGDHTLSQDGINQLLVDLARSGKTVARLKGGDPFIFGRGGEEAEVLLENGFDYEVVPGVTAAIAATAYAGIPLTHRKLTSTLAFVTGHEDPTKDDTRIDWESLAKGIGTLVFYMGVRNLPNITSRLMAHGRSPETPRRTHPLGDHQPPGDRDRHPCHHRRGGEKGRTLLSCHHCRGRRGRHARHPCLVREGPPPSRQEGHRDPCPRPGE